MTGTPNNVSDILKQAFTAPNAREMFLPTRAAASKIFTVDEAMQLIENIAAALDRTQRLPIRVSVIRNPDGSRTLHVAPERGAGAQEYHVDGQR